MIIGQREIEITPELVSMVFFAVGLMLGAATLLMARGTRRELAAGWAAALLVPVLDFLIESHAASAGWWRLHGVAPVLGVPLIYPAGWVFISFHFFMLYAAVRRRLRPPVVPLVLFIPLGVGVGMLWNWVGSRYLGTITFDGAALRDVAWVWRFLVAAGLVFFQALTWRENSPLDAK